MREVFEAVGAEWLGGGRVRICDTVLHVSPRRTGVELRLPGLSLDSLTALRRNAFLSARGPHFASGEGGLLLRRIVTVAELLDPGRLATVLRGFEGAGDSDGDADQVEGEVMEVPVFALRSVRPIPSAAQAALACLVLLRDGASLVPGRHHRLREGIEQLTLAQPGDPEDEALSSELESAAAREQRLLVTVAGSRTALRYFESIAAKERRNP